MRPSAELPAQQVESMRVHLNAENGIDLARQILICGRGGYEQISEPQMKRHKVLLLPCYPHQRGTIAPIMICGAKSCQMRACRSVGMRKFCSASARANASPLSEPTIRPPALFGQPVPPSRG